MSENLLFGNFAFTFLTSGVNAGDVSILLPSGTGALFPSPTGAQYFMAVIEDNRVDVREIVKVTARTGDTLTVERAQEGTSAQNFAALSSISMRLTAGQLEAFQARDADFANTKVDRDGDTMTGALYFDNPGTTNGGISGEGAFNGTMLFSGPGDTRFTLVPGGDAVLDFEPVSSNSRAFTINYKGDADQFYINVSGGGTGRLFEMGAHGNLLWQVAYDGSWNVTAQQFYFPLSVPTPTDPTHAATKDYVDTLLSGGGITEVYGDTIYWRLDGANAPFALPLGSAAAPSIGFSGDTDTGLYSPGADQVGLSTGGTVRLSVDTTAITKTLPTYNPSGTAAAPAFSFTGDTDTGIWHAGANRLAFSTGGLTRLELQDFDHTANARAFAIDGQVVGTSPGGVTNAELRLKPGLDQGAILSFWSRPIDTTSEVRWWLYTGNVGSDLDDTTNVGSDLTLRSWADAGTALRDHVVFQRSTGTTRFSVQGTTGAPTIALGPNSTLGINYSAANTMEFHSNSVARMTMTNALLSLSVPLSISHNNAAGNVIAQQGTGTALKITNTGTGDSFLVEDSASTDTTPFVIKNDGKVGIGLTAPTQLLEVAGNIRGTGDFTLNKATPQVFLDTLASGQSRPIYGRTGGLNRWGIVPGEGTAEAGANAGSDFAIWRYDDAGAFLAAPVVITRSSGLVTFETPPQVAADPAVANALARKNYVDTGDIWVKIADQVPSAVGAIDVTWAAGAYRAIEVILSGIFPGTVGAGQNLLTRVNVGGTFATGGTDYNTQSLAQEGATISGIALDGSAWWFSRGGFASATDELSGRFLIDPGISGLEPGFNGHERHSAAAPARRQGILSGSFLPGGPVSGLRFLWEAGGTFAAQGRITVLGLKL